MLIFPLTILLCTQATLATLLCLPLKPLTKLALLITGLLRQQALRIVVGTLTAVLLTVLAFSGFRMRQLAGVMSQGSAQSSVGSVVYQESRQELYAEGLQSSLIISCLLLGMTIARIDEQLCRNKTLQANFDVMLKQAKGTQQEYMRQMDEKAKTSAAAAPAPSPKAHEEASAEAKKENSILKEDNEKLRRDVRKADASVAALKKQTEGLTLEFSRLMEENESLRAQLSIFDRKYAQSDDKKRT